MKKLLIPVLFAGLAVGCTGDTPTSTDGPTPDFGASGAPISFPLGPDSFDDVNPCTGLDHKITVTGTSWLHDHGDQAVIRTKRTVTTDTGFEGRGTTTQVVLLNNAGLVKFTLNDMLKHPSGAQIRAHFVGLLDLSTAPPTARVEKGTVSCVRS